MMDPLWELLRPYQDAMSGAEVNYRQDPVYSTLFPTQGIGGGAQQRGPTSIPNAPQNIDAIVAMGKRLAAKQGWTGDQWDALYALWQRESGWSPTADNPTSTAYGIPQFLDSTRANYGLPLHAGPRSQIKAGERYISDRYGDPIAALMHSNSTGWY